MFHYNSNFHEESVRFLSEAASNIALFLLLLSTILFVPFDSSALTISGNITWTSSGSPYIFAEDVIIEHNASLTLTPGTVVKFSRKGRPVIGKEEGYHLFVKGTLKIRGERENHVILKGLRGIDDEWGGIVFEDESVDAEISPDHNYISGSIIENAEIKNAGDSAVYAKSASPYFHLSLFLNNSANYDKGEEIVVDPDQEPQERIMGGAIYLYRCDTPVIIDSCKFISNISANVGGAVAMAETYSTEMLVTGCFFKDNEALTRGGGAIRMLGASPILKNSKFVRNSAERGGAIHGSYGANARIDGCNFAGNCSQKAGGAIFFAHDSSPVIIKSVLNYNTVLEDSDMGGGAIAIHANCSADIEYCHFEYNKAPAGGAILITLRNITPEDSCFLYCDYFKNNEVYLENRGTAIELADYNRVSTGNLIFNDTGRPGVEILVAVGAFPIRLPGEPDFRNNYWERGSSHNLVKSVSWKHGLDPADVIVGDDLEELPACATSPAD